MVCSQTGTKHRTTWLWNLFIIYFEFSYNVENLNIGLSPVLIPMCPLNLLLFPSLPTASVTIYSSSVSVQCTVTMLSVFGSSHRGKQNDTMLAAAALTSSHSLIT